MPWSTACEPWFVCVQGSYCLCLGSAVSLGPVRERALPCPASESFLITAMVRTRGGSRIRPRVRFSTPEREEQNPDPAPVPAPVPEVVHEEPQGFRRYQTLMGPRASSPVPQRRSRRARPSKQARTSGPGESSSSRPEPSPSVAEATSSPHYRLPRGSGALYSSGTPSRGMYSSTVESSMESRTTTSQR